jgi:glycine/D-amino acid oxidase-like deaminating enzyme
MNSARIAAIGGGLGGLSVALELKRRGFEVIVFERRESIGNAHNVLGGSFRPLNHRADVPVLYVVARGGTAR